MNSDINTIYAEIYAERLRQNAKWGASNIVNRFAETGYRVLGEEVGEVAEAINDDDRKGCRAELIQVAAVAVAMIEALDNDTPLVRR